MGDRAGHDLRAAALRQQGCVRLGARPPGDDGAQPPSVRCMASMERGDVVTIGAQPLPVFLGCICGPSSGCDGRARYTAASQDYRLPYLHLCCRAFPCHPCFCFPCFGCVSSRSPGGFRKTIMSTPYFPKLFVLENTCGYLSCRSAPRPRRAVERIYAPGQTLHVFGRNTIKGLLHVAPDVGPHRLKRGHRMLGKHLDDALK